MSLHECIRTISTVTVGQSCHLKYLYKSFEEGAGDVDLDLGSLQSGLKEFETDLNTLIATVDQIKEASGPRSEPVPKILLSVLTDLKEKGIGWRDLGRLNYRSKDPPRVKLLPTADYFDTISDHLLISCGRLTDLRQNGSILSTQFGEPIRLSEYSQKMQMLSTVMTGRKQLFFDNVTNFQSQQEQMSMEDHNDSMGMPKGSSEQKMLKDFLAIDGMGTRLRHKEQSGQKPKEQTDAIMEAFSRLRR